MAWLESGEITVEEDLLEALSSAPLPRKGAAAASKPAPTAGVQAAKQTSGTSHACSRQL